MLNNKIIVIIGGTSGIGLAAGIHFIALGAKIVVVGNRTEDIQIAQNTLGASAVVILADATNKITSLNAIELAINKFGGFDGLFHVAGGSGRKFGDGPLHEVTEDGWQKTMDLNLKSIFHSNQAATNYFLKNKRGGSILNVGSVLGNHPSKQYFNTITYATAKAAIEGFTKSAASYYADKNIRFNVLAPGLIATPMSERAQGDVDIQAFIKSKQPLDGGRVGNVNDLVGAASYFMSDFSKFTTGQVLTVSGGWEISDGQINTDNNV